MASTTTEDRFFASIRAEGEHWIWTGPFHDGVPVFEIEPGRFIDARVYSLLHFAGCDTDNSGIGDWQLRPARRKRRLDA